MAARTEQTAPIPSKDSLLQEIGGFPLGIKSGEDLLTWARIAVRTQWAYSLRGCAVYNLGDGYDKRNLPPRRQDEGDPVGKGLLTIYEANPALVGMGKYLSHWHKMRASVAIRYGEWRETLYEVRQSLKYNPFNYKVAAFAVLAVLPKRIRSFIIHRS